MACAATRNHQQQPLLSETNSPASGLTISLLLSRGNVMVSVVCFMPSGIVLPSMYAPSCAISNNPTALHLLLHICVSELHAGVCCRPGVMWRPG